jgi:hypothetical protein
MRTGGGGFRFGRLRDIDVAMGCFPSKRHAGSANVPDGMANAVLAGPP